MFPLTITDIQDEKELSATRDFLLKQPQFYPKYQDWVDGKCIPRVESGEYSAVVALSDGIVIGNAIHRLLPDGRVEIKNFRIDPKYRNRDLGHFLLTQVRHDIGSSDMVLDVTVDNFSGVEFFLRNGFHIMRKEHLYQPDQAEYVMLRKGPDE